MPILDLFDLADVRLLEGPFRHAEELNRTYLLSLDPARLLYHFHVNAGIPTTARPYGGWEAADWDFPGHTLGHYLTACAQMAAHGGEPEFQRRVDYIVAELAKCQAALAHNASYPGFLDPQPESVFERLERGEKVVGVPYYTLHKTLAGLIDAYALTHNVVALDVARGMAAWLKSRCDRLTDSQLQAVLRIEYGGMNEALANLAAITDSPEDLRLAERFNHELLFRPFARDEDPLGPGPGLRLIHANTQVPKALGAAREYELSGNATYRAVATNFWRNVALTRSFIIGGNSEAEHFFERGAEARYLTPRTAEGCNTYNMLKLTRHLFSWQPSAELMDFYERALFNHVLAAQNPDTGMNTYFMSLEPGGRKRFGTAEDTFWCCTGTSMESESKFADSIYAHDNDSLYVNLFVASELRWRAKEVVVRQITRFPEDDTVEFVLQAAHPQRLALKIRDPYWCEGFSLSVNGEAQAIAAKPASYVTIDRVWQNGDRVNVRLPMRVRAVPLPEEPTWVALMYGPLVLAGRLGRMGLEFKPAEFVDNGKDSRGPRVSEAPMAVPALAGPASELAAHVQRETDGGLAFKTVGLGRPSEVSLVPLNRIVDEYYTVYWRVLDPAAAATIAAEIENQMKIRQAADARIVDAVWAGLSKSEAAHGAVAECAPVVSSRLSLFRDATDGSVAWKLKTDAGRQMMLRVGYLGGDAAAFDIFVEGKKLASEQPAKPAPIAPNRATVTTIKEYAVPASLSAGPVLEVKLVGHRDLGPARLVFCELSRVSP